MIDSLKFVLSKLNTNTIRLSVRYTTITPWENINNLYKQLTIHYRESPSLQCNGNKARPGQTSRMRWLNNNVSTYARCSAVPAPEPNCAHGRPPAVRLWNIYPRPRRVLGAVGLGWQLKLEMRIGDDVAPTLSLKIKIEYAEIKTYKRIYIYIYTYIGKIQTISYVDQYVKKHDRNTLT